MRKYLKVIFISLIMFVQGFLWGAVFEHFNGHVQWNENTRTALVISALMSIGGIFGFASKEMKDN